MVNLEELLEGKTLVELRSWISTLPAHLRVQIQRTISSSDSAENAAAPRYPAKSQELIHLVSKIVPVMKIYQTKIGRGGAPRVPHMEEKDLLMDGYNWSEGTEILGLKESDGYHGGDFIGVREQVLIETSDTKPKSLGVVTYERGNGKLHAYAIFSLNGGGMYQPSTDDYELAHPTGTIQTDAQPNTVITLRDFIVSVYSSRNSLGLAELRPRPSLTNHLLKKRS